MSPPRSVYRTGKNGGRISSPKTSPSAPSSCRGPYTVSTEPGTCTGGKNGRPCTWSQWMWVTSAVAAKVPSIAQEAA